MFVHILYIRMDYTLSLQGRTIGQILRYHISEPLGAAVYIGLTEEGFK